MVHSSFSFNLMEQFSGICKKYDCPLSKQQKLLLYSYLSQYYYRLLTKGETPSYSAIACLVDKDLRVLPDFVE